jgi:hypothetical protein
MTNLDVELVSPAIENRTVSRNTALAAPKPRGPGRPFEKGNPGRRPGVRNKATQLAEKLLSKDIKDVSNVVVEKAKNGSLEACKVILDRILPVPKSRRITFPMREIHSVADVQEAMNGLWAAVASGGITPEDATLLGKLLEQHAAVLEAGDIEARIAALEADAERRVG